MPGEFIARTGDEMTGSQLVEAIRKGVGQKRTDYNTALQLFGEVARREFKGREALLTGYLRSSNGVCLRSDQPDAWVEAERVRVADARIDDFGLQPDESPYVVLTAYATDGSGKCYTAEIRDGGVNAIVAPTEN